jgi:hypothetical protein
MKNGEPKILNFLMGSPFSVFRSQFSVILSVWRIWRLQSPRLI